MLLTLMMNVGMFGETTPIDRQQFVFESEIEGIVTASGVESNVSFNSTTEQTINARGNENQFRFNSKPTLTI